MTAALHRPARLARLFALSALLAAAAAPASPAASGEPGELHLDLPQAIRLALEKNYAVRIRSFDTPIAQAAVTEALGRFDVTLSGSYATARDKEPSFRSPFTGARTNDLEKTMTASLGIGGTTPLGLSYSIGGRTTDTRDSESGLPDLYTSFAGLTVTQPLLRDFGFGANMIEVRLARTNREVSEWDYRSTLINTITSVIYAYNDLLLAQARLRSAERSRDLALQLCKSNDRRRELGSMSEFDVLSARAKAANREESVLYWSLAVRVAENALKQLVSDERNTDLLNRRLTVPPLTDSLPEVAVNPAEDFRNALTLRPDFRSAQLAVKRGDLSYRHRRNQLLPRVDVTASYGHYGLGTDFASSRADARNRDYPSYSTGVSVSVPLTLSTERGRLRAAKLSLRQAEAELEKLEQDILIDVGNAAMQLETARNRVRSTRAARELNEEVLRAELKKLSAGTGSTFNVLYQQEQLASAETYEAQALCDYHKAVAEYDRQLGRTLITHNVSVSP